MSKTLGNYEIETLTPAQVKAWGDTRAALIWHCPAFSHIFYTMMSKDTADGKPNEHLAIFTKQVPIAATDGQYILLNPDTFFEHDLQERIFIVAHEISHGIFGHVETMHRVAAKGKIVYPDGKELEYDEEDYQMAMDYVINAMLVESKIGKYNDQWLHDTTIATAMDSIMTAYRRIHQDKPKQGGGKQQGQGQGQGTSQGNGSHQPKGGQKGFDQHLKPGQSQGQDPAQAAADRNEVEWKTAIAGALTAARVQGKLPAGLERMLGEVLEPKVDWTDKVLAFFARKPGGGTYDWRKPDRRFITRGIIIPGRAGHGAGDVVVAVDTSGSITQKVLDVFFGEMSGILDDIRPRRLHLVYCDAKIGNTHEIESGTDLLDIKAKGAGGGGGTSFVPVFDWITSEGIEPDALIYLTDGMGRFPEHAPSYPVMWGSIYEKAQYPFGEVIDVPV